jgi:AcrR family transcriptional regulator
MSDPVRQSLLDAAGEVLARDGASALTVRRIAAEAGTSTMGVYSRFGGKDGVVDALLRDGFLALRAVMDESPPTDDPLADLFACSERYRRFALANPTRYEVMFETALPGFEPTDDSMAVAASTFAELVSRVQRCIDAGVLGGARAEEVALSVWATLHGLVSLELIGKQPPQLVDDDPYARTLGALVRGFAP